MARIEIFECDVTGDRYGALNAGEGVYDFTVKEQSLRSPYDVREREYHVSHDEIPDNCITPSVTKLDYIGFHPRNEIEGMKYRNQWRERGRAVTGLYEEFFQFLEDEVLHMMGDYDE